MRKFLIVILLFSGTLQAQFYQYNHPELEWKSFDTEHFSIHFHQGAKRTAYLVAQIAEDIHPHLTELYDYEPDRIHFIIKDTDDYSNGGAFFFDNKIEIWADNLDYIMRGTKNWLRDVVTHEYAHMISIQKMIKSNLRFPYGFIQVFTYEDERRKDVVRGFPNTIVSYPISSVNIPVWFAEGTAQHQADSSRYDYRDPHREMILRDRIMHDQLLTLNSMSVFGKNSHGNESAYNLGFSFVNYITDRFGENVLEEITRISSQWHSYTFESVLQEATGIEADTLYQNWKDSLELVYRRQTVNIRQNEKKGLAVEDRGSANIYPVWSPDGKKIAYVSNRGNDYFSQNALVIYDLETGKKRKIESRIASSLSWSPDGRYIAFARNERNIMGSALDDLYLYNFNKEETIRLTWGMRATHPAFNADGSKLAFVSGTNGLTQLNIYHLPESLTTPEKQTAFFNMESGAVTYVDKSNDEMYRRVEFRSGKNGRVEQVLNFGNDRQIYHPRWSPDGNTIIFDTSIEYGRNLGMYDVQSQQFDFFLKAEEELRYPVFSPDGQYVYYSASSTGIYNIYRRHVKSGQTELLTNVVGGAMMPDVNRNGALVYARYDSLGYKIYRMENKEPLNPRLAVYDTDYIESIPAKNFDNTVRIDPEVQPYKQTFTDLHILPRLMIDYGTVKPGFYLLSNDVLDKYGFMAGAAINRDLDYDLYGYVEYNEFWPTIFLEAYNSSANISDTLRERKGTDYVLQYDRDINFDLTEFRAGLSGRVLDFIDYRAAFALRRYNAKIHFNEEYDPVKKEWIAPFTFRYNYLKGYALELALTANLTQRDRNMDINPSGGRYLFFKYSYENSDFLREFAITATDIGEVYDNYSYNQLTLNWEEYIENPLLNNHALTLRVRAGYIDRPVDSFFHLFAGGLIGMKGYSYFSIEGTRKLIATVTYRFPLWQNIDRTLGHIYFDKLYFGIFYDYGNAWTGNDVQLNNFKRDIGFQLRLSTFSYFLFPTRFFAEAVYPLDEIQNQNITYERDWRFYFGALFEFELRERLGQGLNLFKHQLN